MQHHPRAPLNLRVTGRLAVEIARIAERENNSVSAVARRLIVAGMDHVNDSRTMPQPEPSR